MANYGTNSVTPAGGFPATIAASGNWKSGALSSTWGALAAAVTSSQAGALTIQRYADAGLIIPIGALISATLVANTPNYVSVADGVPFLYFQVEITNTGGSTANITGAAILTGIGNAG